MKSKICSVYTLLFITLGFLLFAPALLPAQTAAELENILETPAITRSQAARFVLTSSRGPASVGREADAAFESVKARGWLPKESAANDPITLGTLSYMIMKAFDLKGGMMYNIVPGPRYAFRTMVSRSFIQGSADPAMKVSGERFLLILGNVLNSIGGEE